MWNPSTPSRADARDSSVSLASGPDLPVRTACNHCRAKKIRCDKLSLEEGGCSRCRREGIDCNYDVREPIGRPRKRRGEVSESSHSPPAASPRLVRRKTRDSTPRSRGTATSGATPPENLSTGQPAGWSGAGRDATTAWLPPHSSSHFSTTAPPSSSMALSSPYQSTALDSRSASTGRSSVDRSSLTSVETARQQGDSPTLSDLGLAAFLESLDTLEINTEDGLTPHMLQGLHGRGGVGGGNQGVAGIHTSLFDGATPGLSGVSFSSLMDAAQSSTSYAVPADLSWADPSWLLSSAKNSQPMSNGVDSMARRGAVSSTLSSSSPSSSSLPNAAKEGAAKVKVEGPCPKTGSTTCCCGAEETSSVVTEPSTRVHCVPNPTGKGCTCLCDMHSLINVRATLRQARDQAQEEQGLGESGRQNGKAKRAAASTLQLTLSASQAVAAQCACSASCPTCRSDPNTSLSASLLVSTALQIYIRAVQTLRQGFGAQESGPASEWDVSIGQYKPKPMNARRIALFAMKLELISLRDALGKVSSAATGEEMGRLVGQAASSQAVTNADGLMEGVNPIDQVVIRKLHQQLGELLSTVEGIEQQQQDATRGGSV